MEEVKLGIRLHVNQQLILDSKALNVVVKAGKRFGKSELAIFKVIQESGRKRGVYWYIAPYFSHAESIAWTGFMRLIPSPYIERTLQNKLYIKLINGSEIFLKGADNQVSLRGPKLDGVVLDEAAYMDEYIWNNILRGQLLGVNGEKPGFAFFISSPINPSQLIGKKGRDWYPEFYAEAMRKKMDGDASWDAFKFTIYDNPLLGREYIDAIKSDSTTEDEWNIEYMAEESSYSGQVYGEFSFERHVKEMGVKNVDLLVRSIDWGIDHPTVCLFAQVDLRNQVVHIEDEYVHSGYTIEESVDIIRKKTGGRVVDWTVCDPSLNKRNSQTKRTDKQEFDRLGVYCIPGDNNNRGYNITKMFLKKGMITIHPKCKALINQLKNLQWTDKVNDDACFVSGTKISCFGEYKNIEDVKIGDRVLTREGYKKVLDSSITSLGSDIYELKTNKYIIRGTANHPFFISDGTIKRMDELKQGDILFDSRFYNLIQYGICKLMLLQKLAKTLMDYPIIGWVGDTFKDVFTMVRKLSCYIERYGNIIMEKYQKITIFTTKIMTNPIMTYQIWNCFPVPNILEYTQLLPNQEENQLKISLNTQSQSQFIGINLMREENGINYIQKKCGNIKNGMKENATFVEEFTKHLFQRGLNFVILIAKWLIFGQNAVVSVTSLPTKQSVYNLTIENGEYIANGLLVHNCDCLRYLCVRLHDLVWNGLFNKEGMTSEKRNPLEFNLNDPYLFPEVRSGNQYRSEVATY